VFEQAYTTCPICTPARASLHTGLYPFAHGMQTNIFTPGCRIHQIPDTEHLLSRRLNQAGYRAGFTGKWHLGYDFEDPFYVENYKTFDSHFGQITWPEAYTRGRCCPTDLGFVGDNFPGHGGGGNAYPQFHAWLEANGRTQELKKIVAGFEVCSGEETTIDHYLATRTLELMEDMRQQDKPFSMMLNFWGPHSPVYVPSRFLEQIQDADIEPWVTLHEEQTNKPRVHNMKRSNVNWDFFRERIRHTLAYTSYIDWEIGRVLRYLKETGLEEETAVIFTADHGDSLGIHHGLFDKGIFMYEETTAIPLIVRMPGGETRRCSGLVSITDIYSTILDIAGVPESGHRRHGRSLVPLVEGNTVPDWRDRVVTECSGIEHFPSAHRMLRKDRLKYVFNGGDMEELYDLDSDPYEMENLVSSGDHEQDLSEMRQALDEWMTEMSDPIQSAYRNIFRLEGAKHYD